MAQFKNTSRPNRSTLYIAMSGGGKSQALLQNSDIPAQGARTLLFDPNEDHPWCSRFDDLEKYKQAVRRCLKMWYQAKRGFRVAYTGLQSPDIHEQWCKFVFSCLDGNFETYIIDEEISGSYGGQVSKAAYNHAMLMNQGRKFGGIYHGTTQKPQEIPKTVYDQCAVWWIGELGSSTAKYVSEEMRVTPQSLMDQQPLQFTIKDKMRYGFTAKNTQLQYKKPETVQKSQRKHVIK